MNASIIRGSEILKGEFDGIPYDNVPTNSPEQATTSANPLGHIAVEAAGEAIGIGYAVARNEILSGIAKSTMSATAIGRATTSFRSRASPLRSLEQRQLRPRDSHSQ